MEITPARTALSSQLRPLQRSEVVTRAEAQAQATGSSSPPRQASLTEYVSEGEHLQRDPLDYADTIRRARLQQATAQPENSSREQPANYQTRQALSAYSNNGPDDGIELLPRIDSYI